MKPYSIYHILHTNTRGQSLIEVLIALSIFVVGIVAVGFIILEANTSSRQSVERTEAIMLAREGLEAARSMRDADFDNLTAGVHGLALSASVWVFSGSSDTSGSFTRTLNIADIDTDTKAATSTVTWNISSARVGSVSFHERFSDWRQSGGDAGSLSVDISGAALSASSTDLLGITIENTGPSTITVDSMTLQWSNSNVWYFMKIDDVTVFSTSTSQGASSGENVDISDVVLANGSGVKSINIVTFDGVMSGTDFIVTFVMSDQSTRHILIDL